MDHFLRRFDDLSRRNFVTYAAKTFLGVGLMSPVAASPAFGAVSRPRRMAKNVIYLFMNGGMSHLDTLDPKTDSEVAGPVGSIRTRADGVRISEYLPKLAEHTDKMAILRSLTSTQGAHERGRYVMRTSYMPRGTIRHPAMGAWLLKIKGRENETLPGNVLIGGEPNHPGAGFMESQYTPLRIGAAHQGLQDAKPAPGITAGQFDRRLQLADQFDRTFQQRYPHQNVKAYSGFYEDAVRLMKSKDLEAFDINKEQKDVRDAYGNNRFGQACLLARRLVQHGVRYVEVDHGGWDTHENNFDQMPNKCGEIDRAIAALFSDLDSKGLLDETLVVLATEFGRTPNINDQAGRDHHPRAFSGFIAGGGIQGGQAYGKSDAKGYAVEEDGIEIPDFNATIAYALDLPIDRKVTSPSGRPFTIADEGKPVTALFG